MHSINLTQFKDDDDEVITTAETDPAAMSVSVRTTGEIVDVDIPMPRGLSKGLEGRHGLRARRVSISFFGLCGQCEVPGTRIQRSSTMQRSNHEPTRSREQEGRHG